jgi:hypothetical protein
VSLEGRVTPVPAGAAADAALAALAARHPAMATWPADHGFAPYELHVDRAKVLSWYGGVSVVSAAEYYGAPAPAA